MVRSLGLAARVVSVLVAAALAYLLLTFGQVWLASSRDEARPSQAIVVLGAAQYDGRPSPALRNRLDHAAQLYRRDLADVVVVTGGRQPGDRYSEASASASYLHRRGVPERALLREVEGRSSWESLAATARFLRARQMRRVLLVSDPYHAYRIAAIAREVGLRPHVSPNPGSSDARKMLREAGLVAAGRLISYRRLDRLDRLASPGQAPRRG